MTSPEAICCEPINGAECPQCGASVDRAESHSHEHDDAGCVVRIWHISCVPEGTVGEASAASEAEGRLCESIDELYLAWLSAFESLVSASNGGPIEELADAWGRVQATQLAATNHLTDAVLLNELGRGQANEHGNGNTE